MLFHVLKEQHFAMANHRAKKLLQDWFCTSLFVKVTFRDSLVLWQKVLYYEMEKRFKREIKV